jgi:hypothetical protein
MLLLHLRGGRSCRRSEVADTRADVPGGRVHRVVAAEHSRDPDHRRREGFHMAKKAAKGAKKKAAKKR